MVSDEQKALSSRRHPLSRIVDALVMPAHDGR